LSKTYYQPRILLTRRIWLVLAALNSIRSYLDYKPKFYIFILHLPWKDICTKNTTNDIS
jgi:hypothetical protein